MDGFTFATSGDWKEQKRDCGINWEVRKWMRQRTLAIERHLFCIEDVKVQRELEEITWERNALELCCPIMDSVAMCG